MRPEYRAFFSINKKKKKKLKKIMNFKDFDVKWLVCLSAANESLLRTRAAQLAEAVATVSSATKSESQQAHVDKQIEELCINAMSTNFPNDAWRLAVRASSDRELVSWRRNLLCVFANQIILKNTQLLHLNNLETIECLYSNQKNASSQLRKPVVLAKALEVPLPARTTIAFPGLFLFLF